MKRARDTDTISTRSSSSSSHWPLLIPEMQGEVVGHLDTFSKQALALTCKDHCARWKKKFWAHYLTFPFKLGRVAPKTYIDNYRNAAARSEEEWLILHWPALLLGIAVREDKELFMEYATHFQERPERVIRKALKHTFQWDPTNPLLPSDSDRRNMSALFHEIQHAANSPTMFTFIAEHYPHYIHIWSQMEEDLDYGLTACMRNYHGLVKPQAAMYPLLVQQYPFVTSDEIIAELIKLGRTCDNSEFLLQVFKDYPGTEDAARRYHQASPRHWDDVVARLPGAFRDSYYMCLKSMAMLRQVLPVSEHALSRLESRVTRLLAKEGLYLIIQYGFDEEIRPHIETLFPRFDFSHVWFYKQIKQ
jgi:hypothetical protein